MAIAGVELKSGRSFRVGGKEESSLRMVFKLQVLKEKLKQQSRAAEQQSGAC